MINVTSCCFFIFLLTSHDILCNKGHHIDLSGGLDMKTNTYELKQNGQWKGPNYKRIAQLWSGILGIEITPQQVSLCMAQMHLSEMLDNPTDTEKPLDVTSCIFAYEAFQGKEK